MLKAAMSDALLKSSNGMLCSSTTSTKALSFESNLAMTVLMLALPSTASMFLKMTVGYTSDDTKLGVKLPRCSVIALPISSSTRLPSDDMQQSVSELVDDASYDLFASSMFPESCLNQLAFSN